MDACTCWWQEMLCSKLLICQTWYIGWNLFELKTKVRNIAAVKPCSMFRLTIPLVAGIFVSDHFFQGALPVLVSGTGILGYRFRKAVRRCFPPWDPPRLCGRGRRGGHCPNSVYLSAGCWEITSFFILYGAAFSSQKERLSCFWKSKG